MKYIFVIIIFSVIFSLEMLGSGLTTNDGLVLRGVNRTDGIWNIGLIQELKYHFPPEHPGFSELPLKGYHFLFHLLVAIVSIITFIPVTFLYFQVFPLLISFLWGLGVFKTVMLMTKNRTAAYISTFISFFGGSLAFIFPLIGQINLSIDSGLGIAQPYGSSVQNPAYASSIVLVIWSLYCLLRYLSDKQKKWLIIIAVFSGLAVGFKAYAGMILMGSLLVSALFRTFFEKKLDILLAFIAALVISMVVFYPFNADYGFLVYAPFLHIIRMIEGPLNFTNWDELFHIQREINNNFGMAKLFSLVFVIFTLGNIGSRIVGVAGFFSSTIRLSLTAKLYILSLIGSSFIIPFFFIQPAGGSFNITQMHWYFLFFISLFTGPGIVFILKKIQNITLQYLFVTVFMAVTLPSSYVILHSNIVHAPIGVSRDQLELNQFLARYGTYDDTVLEIPNIPSFEKEDIEAWFWRESNVIIPALGLKRAFLSNEIVIFPYEERHDRYQAFVAFEEAKNGCDGPEARRDICEIFVRKFVDFMIANNIKILYLPKQMIISWPENSRLKFLTKNETATLYEVLPL